MWTFYLFVATISFIYAQANDYQSLGADMPTPLAEHITAVYNDYLYVFGGKNETGTFNNRFWRLPLGGISLSGTNDITSSITSASWELLTVTGPTYGPASTSGTEPQEFACVGQCSAVIGQYVYIVGAYTSAANSVTPQDTVYRLDLSSLTFSGESAFPSTTGYGTATYGQCVTAIDGILYTVAGAGQNDLVSSTATAQDTSLTAYPGTGGTGQGNFEYRTDAGCGGGNNDANLWLLGGISQNNQYLVYADDYLIDPGTWTTRNFGKPGAFDAGDSTANAARRQSRCLASLYGEFIECAGGIATQPKDTSVVYDTTAYLSNSAANTYSNLLSATYSAGLGQLSLLNDGTNAAELMIVTGGYSNNKPSNVTQYAVRYTVLPVPTMAPTKSPSKSPSPGPTKSPSRSPLCADCTFPPTGSPTTAAPTTSTEVTEPGSGVAQMCVVVSCIMAFISVIII